MTFSITCLYQDCTVLVLSFNSLHISWIIERILPYVGYHDIGKFLKELGKLFHIQVGLRRLVVVDSRNSLFPLNSHNNNEERICV